MFLVVLMSRSFVTGATPFAGGINLGDTPHGVQGGLEISTKNHQPTAAHTMTDRIEVGHAWNGGNEHPNGSHSKLRLYDPRADPGNVAVGTPVGNCVMDCLANYPTVLSITFHYYPTNYPKLCFSPTIQHDFSFQGFPLGSPQKFFESGSRISG